MLTCKQELFARYMYTPGSETFGNGTESARKAGYTGTDSYLAMVASRNIRIDKIIAEKRRLQRENTQETQISRKYLTDKLRSILESETSSKRDVISAASLIGDFCGFKRDNAPNAEKERAIVQRMTDEERKLAELAARLRTEAESRPKIKLAKATG